ncbi:hypothetical protein GmHk_01G001409 [Glycine max]|nr:hypothetical protein GmHk_01G001409 [Glycine max]
MATPPGTPPPPFPPSPPPPPPTVASQSSSTLKRTQKATRLRYLATRAPGEDRPVVHVDPAIGKADGPHKKKLRTYLGIVARDNVDVEMGPVLSNLQRPLVGEHPDRVRAAGAEPEVGPSVAHVSTKGSCVDPSATDPDTGDSNKCGLYIEENSSCLVALGRVYEGSTAVHNIPLLHGQVRVGVEEVKDADAPVPVPTDEVAMSPAKPTDGPDPQQDFPLYIKHEDLSEIPDSGQCLSISVIQLWILHPTKTSMRAGNSDVYGFLEPQSIHRSGQSQFESESYMKSWMQNSKCDVYLRAYLNGPYNYLKRIINRSVLFFNTFALVLLNNINILMFFVFNTALKGLDDTPQPKSKAGARWIVFKCNRQKGSTECGYYVMHWMSTIILGSFRNNCETYFNDVSPLEAKRLKALRIQWAQYYLKVRNQT